MSSKWFERVSKCNDRVNKLIKWIQGNLLLTLICGIVGAIAIGVIITWIASIVVPSPSVAVNVNASSVNNQGTPDIIIGGYGIDNSFNTYTFYKVIPNSNYNTTKTIHTPSEVDEVPNFKYILFYPIITPTDINFDPYTTYSITYHDWSFSDNEEWYTLVVNNSGKITANNLIVNINTSPYTLSRLIVNDKVVDIVRGGNLLYVCNT